MNEPTDTTSPHPRDATSPGGAATSRWQRHPRALWRRSSDRIVVLAPDQTEPLLLEGTGTVIWELLEQPTGEQDLVDLLVEATTADRDVIAPEVAAFLTQLANEHVVEQQP